MDFVAYQRSMKLLGVSITLLSIVEIGLTAAVNMGYWGPIFMLITGFLGLGSRSRGVVMSGTIFATISIILMLAVALVNAAFYKTIRDTATCASEPNSANVTSLSGFDEAAFVSSLSNQYGVTFYGESSYDYDVGSCIVKNYQEYYYCYCSTSSGDCSEYAVTGPFIHHSISSFNIKYMNE